MIIQCTACEKKFSVPDSAIATNGRLVQCSSCGNQWTQYPIKTKTSIPGAFSAPRNIVTKKPPKKNKGPIPYSKEYMQQKWGTSVQNYALDKGLSKKIKTPKKIEKIGFGFFNYIIVIFIFSTFFIGILNFERSRIGRKFPFLEPYVDHFFESLEIFKVLILDFFR